MAKTIFTDGDPLHGVLGTVVDAAFLNLVFNHQHDGANDDGHAPILQDNVTTVNAAYAVQASDIVLLADASGAAFAITLPSAVVVGAGRKYAIKKIDNSINAVTLAPAGGQTIDGAANAVLSSQNAVLVLMSDGANWQLIGPSSQNSKVSAYMSADQNTFVTGTPQILEFDAENFDTNNEFDIGAYKFTATKAGFYKIDSNVLYNMEGHASVAKIMINKNGTVIAMAERNLLSSNWPAQTVSLGVSALLKLVPGDYITISFAFVMSGIFLPW